MPIYEYAAINPENGCNKCEGRFEIIQGINEKPLSICLYCGQKVKRVISWCRAAIIEASDEHIMAQNRVREFEKQGMWSHAAELADTHSEKAEDKDMKIRALENYKKAGYDTDAWETP